VPSGATFANQLGLSTQVPMRAIFQTTGRARRYQIGGTNVELRHVSPRRLKASSPRNLAVLSAIAHLGKANIDETTLARLRSVTERADDASLLDDARNQPAWVVAVVRQVMARTTAAAAPDAGVTTPPSRRRMRGG
jgi:hypothetical protein